MLLDMAQFAASTQQNIRRKPVGLKDFRHSSVVNAWNLGYTKWHWLNQSLRLHTKISKSLERCLCKVIGIFFFSFSLLPPLPEFIATLYVFGLSFGCGSILLAFHFAESSFTLNILVVVFAPHIPRFRIGL